MALAKQRGKKTMTTSQTEFVATSEGSQPVEETIACEGKVSRDKTGAVTIYLKSPILEDIFNAMTGGRTANRDLANGAIALHDSITGEQRAFARQAKVYYNDSVRFAGESAGMVFADQPYYSGKPSVLALAAVGLRSGITWRIEQPMTAEQLEKYAESLKRGVKAIFDSVRPVDISFKMPIKKPAPAAATAK